MAISVERIETIRIKAPAINPMMKMRLNRVMISANRLAEVSKRSRKTSFVLVPKGLTLDPAGKLAGSAFYLAFRSRFFFLFIIPVIPVRLLIKIRAGFRFQIVQYNAIYFRPDILQH